MKYIALLRGINVSGQKLIKMEALRLAMQELPIENVSTYIQSGNVFFDADSNDADAYARLIHEKISERFGFDVSVIIVTPSELKTTVRQNPFASRTAEDSTQPYVGFLSHVPEQADVDVLKAIDFKGDEFAIVGKRIYLWYADSAGNTKLSNAVFEKKLRVTSTARNWKTVKKLIALSEPG